MGVKPQEIRSGERCKHARLTDDLVRQIRKEHAAGSTQKAIVERYGLNQSVVSNVVRRLAWAHVDD